MRKLSEDSPVVEPNWIRKEDFEYLCFQLAKELLTYGEPIPDFETCDLPLLESALAAPAHGLLGKLLYPTLEKQASILFYSMIKNHPFKNGNKRIAVMTLIVFLYINRQWLNISSVDLYILATTVSESDPKKRNQIIRRVEKAITENLSSLP